MRERDCRHGSLARSCEVCDLQAEVKMLRDLAWDVTEQIHRNLVEHPEPWFLETLDKLVDLIGDDSEVE